MKSPTFTNRHRNLLLGFLAAVAAVALIYILARHGIGVPCLFLKLTGFQCPGCGNTRAALALLRLDATAAFGYNPLFLLEFFYLLWVLFHCCKSYLKGGRFSYTSPALWLDAAILVVLLAWWVLRNLI